MARFLGPLPAEFSEAESAKFNAPIILVHGLWDAPHSWRRITSFLSHRGWRCISVGWSNDHASLHGRRRALRMAMAQLDSSAVLIGHDLGGSLVLDAAEHACAVIALAPLLNTQVLHSSGTWLQWLRRADRLPGKTLAASYPNAVGPEPVSLLSEVLSQEQQTPMGGSTAKLIVVGQEDGLATPEDASAFATSANADFEVVEGPHALHTAEGWEKHAGLIHRWLIKNLGEELLAFYEEAWADRDPS